MPPRRSAVILELEDVLFHLNSAVVLPAGPEGPSEADGTGPTAEQLQVSGLLVLAAVLRYLARHPCKRLLIAGHTDTSGGSEHNLSLSEKRAQSVLHLLRGDRTRWVELVDEQSKVEDYQTILDYMSIVWAWDCEPGPIDNVHGPKTTRGVRGFQERYNEEFEQEISVDGAVGTETWGAIFDVYERDIAGLVGTSPTGLDNWRTYVRFADPNHPVLACGETMPLDEIGRDGYRSQANRRVEFAFFDREEIGDNGLFEVEPTPDNRFTIYNEALFQREYISPSTIFEDAKVSIEVEYVPDATLRTPLVLKDESGNEISAPEDVMTEDWRVVFTDDHMLPQADINMLGATGENRSVPDFYRSEGWDPTSTPVLPLKITVTKEGEPIGAGAVSLGAQLLVEPTETTSLTPASEQTFIEDTFDALAYTDPADADLNANNAPDTVEGIRPAGSFQTAESRFATFDGQNHNMAVPITDLQDQDRQAIVDVPASSEQDCTNESVVYLLVYLPQQTGERYRLRFHILGQSTDNVVTSEILTVWRRLRIELVVNIGTALTDAILNDVQDAYEQFYIELGDPEHTTTLSRREWRNITYQYFNGISYPDADDASAYKYDTYLLPDIEMNGDTAKERKREASRHAKVLTRLYRTRGLSDANITNPTGNLIVYGPPIHPATSTLGFYLGDALSAFFRGDRVRSTFVHEIGHGRFLRHSFTSRVSGNPTYDGMRIYPTSNRRFWRDHHQGFGGGCTMSYTRDRTQFKFCAMCQLSMRFWDKVALRPLVQDALDQGWGALVIVRGNYNDITDTIEASVGDSTQLRVLAGPDRSGDTDYYKDVTRHGVITWNAQPAGIVRVDANGEVEAVASGTATVRASVGATNSNAIRIRVT